MPVHAHDTNRGWHRDCSAERERERERERIKERERAREREREQKREREREQTCPTRALHVLDPFTWV